MAESTGGGTLGRSGYAWRFRVAGAGLAAGLGRSAGRATGASDLADPWAAISATRLGKASISDSRMPASGAASPRAASGSHAREKPSLAASFSRAPVCATGRIAPDNETSPN
jgi:hypothetical protein